MKTIRGFLAIKLDLITVRELAGVVNEIRPLFEEAGMGVRWVPPPNLHVTMRFLGQVTEPMAYALKDMLKPIVSRTEFINLTCGGLGIFPDEGDPRVVWVGLKQGGEGVTTLQAEVSERLKNAGFALDDKPFRAHITLGRVKEGATGSVADILSRYDEAEFGTTVVRNLYCYRSDLAPKGAEYHQIWRLPFSGAARRVEREIRRGDPTKRRTEPLRRAADTRPQELEPDEAAEATLPTNNEEEHNDDGANESQGSTEQ